jgi:predicted TIM-barrel enzyme
MNELTVFDPRGRVDAERVALAPRVAALKGLRLGILDNTKWNANRLLRKTAARLEERHGIGVVNCYKKESFSKSADPSLIAAIAAANDIVLTAIGD